jgi:predicted negative regulator of RcsB-dependent stress response
MGFATGPKEGLQYLKTVKGLEANSIYEAALGDCYVRLNDNQAAVTHYTSAMTLTQSPSEIDLLKTKINSLTR